MNEKSCAPTCRAGNWDSIDWNKANVWKLYESIMCIYFDMEEIIKQAVYLQGAYDRERMLK